MVAIVIHRETDNRVKDNLIPTLQPSRPAGQRSVEGLALPPMECVRVGFVGLGQRGLEAVKRWCHIDRTEIVAVCDLSADRVAAANGLLRDHGRPTARAFASAEALCACQGVDLVYVCTDWATHFPIACCALECGHHVAVEVPAVMTVSEAWQLVDLAERQQLHCMMLENCCYDYFEMATAAMARSGLLGTVLHGEGGYCHELGEKWEPWRLRYNAAHRGDVYPTHGLGPVCMAMNINRGDRLRTLVSIDTMASAEVADRYARMAGNDGRPQDAASGFANGAVTTTLMRTDRGHTIQLSHDVQTPRPYSRGYRLVGTQGFADKYPVEQLWMEGREVAQTDIAVVVDCWLPDDVRRMRAVAAQYDNRGGISYVMDSRLVGCLLDGRPLDMDVYDMAAWCSVVELSERSVSEGFAPVRVPDFCRG